MALLLDRMSIPALVKRLIAKARIVEPPAESVMPLTNPPAEPPSNSISGIPAKPGWVEPSMMTGKLIRGSSESGWIVCGPSLGMLKWISSGRPALGPTAFMASRSEPAPESAVLMTIKVASKLRTSSDSRNSERDRVRLCLLPARLVALRDHDNIIFRIAFRKRG